jgi:hypothetical protein
MFSPNYIFVTFSYFVWLTTVKPFNMNGLSPTLPRDTHCHCSQTLNCSYGSRHLECAVSLIYASVGTISR